MVNMPCSIYIEEYSIPKQLKSNLNLIKASYNANY